MTLPGVFVVHSLDDFHHLCADIFGVEHFHIVSVAADLLIEIVGGVQAVAEDGIAVLGTAAVFTGRTLAGLTAAGMALTVGTVTISTAELAILCGFVLAYNAIGNSKVEFMPNGPVKLRLQYKD